MREVTAESLAEVVEAIVEEFDPEQIILFGSRATGVDRAGSDADLLIIESQAFGPDRSRWQESSRLWDLVARFRMPIDVILYSREEVDRWRGSRRHVIGRATSEGKSLYERR